MNKRIVKKLIGYTLSLYGRVGINASNDHHYQMSTHGNTCDWHEEELSRYQLLLVFLPNWSTMNRLKNLQNRIELTQLRSTLLLDIYATLVYQRAEVGTGREHNINEMS